MWIYLLSDHAQFKYIQDVSKILRIITFLLQRKVGQKISFKWNSQKSKVFFFNQIKKNVNTIIEFEIQNFKENQNGVNEGTNKLTNILCDRAMPPNIATFSKQ